MVAKMSDLKLARGTGMGSQVSGVQTLECGFCGVAVEKAKILTSAQMLVPSTGAQQDGSSLQCAGQCTLENKQHLGDGQNQQKTKFLEKSSWPSLFEHQDLSTWVKGNYHTVYSLRKRYASPTLAVIKIFFLKSAYRILKPRMGRHKLGDWD